MTDVKFCYIAIIETIWLCTRNNKNSIKNVIYKLFLNIIYIFDMYV